MANPEYRKEGAAALAHGNRGRRANNSIPEEARTQVVALARTRYARVNHTHLTELLAEREEIVLGRSTVRRILVGAGMASPRRRRPPLHRVRRQRMSQEGMLVQVDGSVHAWLEERGPRCTLLLAIDDATSTVPYALFRHEEDTHGYFLLMQELIRRCGVPLALYSDRHAVFKYVPGSHQSPAPTQFGRAMAELGVEQIFARSPEAKGRVERANGTFQDRLVTELRLAGARTISEANQVLWAFLTRFNKRFGVPPAQSTNAYRSPDPDLNLAGILCFKHSRKVARDNTVKYNWHTLQLLPSSERSTYVGAHVVVQERLDGKLVPPKPRLPSRTLRTPRSDRAGCTNSASATASVRFFLSAWERTVSVLMVPTISHSTNWSANSFRVQGLSGTPLRRFPAGHRDQPCFTFAVQSLLTPTQLLFAIQRRLDPLLLGFTQRLRIRSTVDCPTPSALVMSASFIPPSERDSSLISRMRAWVCLYAAARPRETKALSSSLFVGSQSDTVLLGSFTGHGSLRSVQSGRLRLNPQEEQ